MRADQAFSRAAAALAGEDPPRVWSLLVTAFGDLARTEAARLSGPLLTRLLGRVEIRPEAIRTALHRLRRDGWIDASRRGREGSYALTARGLAESRAASPRIYGPAPAPPETWHLLIAGPGAAEGRAAYEAALRLQGSLALGDTVLMRPGPGPAPEAAAGLLVLAVAPGRAPPWLADRLCPPDLAAAAAGFAQAAARARASFGAADGLPPLDVAALRLLAVHGWRRVALRIPVVPPGFLPATWAGEACRAEVSALLAALPRPDPAVLEQAARAP